MDTVQRVHQHFLDSIELMQSCADLISSPAAAAAELIVGSLMADHKVLVCGNGGSAAEAQHFAAQMLGRFERERPGLAAISLTTDTSTLTAIANDYDYDLVFSKQLRALGQPGDILLAISTSGDSANVIEAVHTAHERHMTVIALTGSEGGKLAEAISGEDLLINVPSTRTARIQEVHGLLLHAICDTIDFILLDGE